MDDPLDNFRKRMAAFRIDDPIGDYVRDQNNLASAMRNLVSPNPFAQAARGVIPSSPFADAARGVMGQMASAKVARGEVSNSLHAAMNFKSTIGEIMRELNGGKAHLSGRSLAQRAAEASDLSLIRAAKLNFLSEQTESLSQTLLRGGRFDTGPASIASAIANATGTFTPKTFLDWLNIDETIIDAATAYYSEDAEEPKDSISRLTDRLTENTKKEIREMSWFHVFQIILFLGTMYQNHRNDLETELHRAQLSAQTAEIERIGEELEQVGIVLDNVASGLAIVQERAALEELPRAIAENGANVRAQPKGSAERIARLSNGQQCAVAEKAGRWVRCVYVDELTQQLMDGWIWSGSLDQI